ncbi:MAG: tetratricopeptide repeat protein [Betaproteobacteria bacterium]
MSERVNMRRSLSRPWQLGLVLVSVAAVVAVLVWWQDRPLAQAEALLQAGHPAEALESLDALLARRPAHQRTLLLRSRALVALQQWQEASQLFAQTGAGTPAELRAWSTALLHQRQWREALPILEQLAAIRGNDAEDLRDLTICRFQFGQADAALASASELASLPGHELDGLLQRGVIHRSLGHTHLAIESWEQIEALTPNATGLPIPPAEFFRVYAEDLMLEARPREFGERFSTKTKTTKQRALVLRSWL